MRDSLLPGRLVVPTFVDGSNWTAKTRNQHKRQRRRRCRDRCSSFFGNTPYTTVDAVPSYVYAVLRASYRTCPYSRRRRSRGQHARYS